MNQATPTSSSVTEREKNIYTIARKQFGIISYAQLLECGLSPAAIHRRVQQSRLHKVHRATYAVGHDCLEPLARMSAALIAVGNEGVLTSESSAYLMGYMRYAPRIIHIVTPRQFVPRIDRVRVSRSRSLVQADVRMKQGLRITSAARTLLELSSTMTAHRVANVMHEAAYRDVLNLNEIRAVIRRHQRRACATRLGEALLLHETGSAGTRSAFEAEFLRSIRAARLPEPRVNCRLNVRPKVSKHDAVLELDFYWPKWNIAVETDGGGHRRPGTKRADAVRDILTDTAKIRVLRCTRRADIAACISELASLLNVTLAASHG